MRRRPWPTSAFGAVVAALVFGCGINDPGYAVAARNESDEALVIRQGASRWLLPAQSSGTLLFTIGPVREANPVDYEILDASCRTLDVQHVDFGLAPNPGYSEFILVVEANTRLRLDILETADQTIGDQLESTVACAPPAAVVDAE